MKHWRPVPWVVIVSDGSVMCRRCGGAVGPVSLPCSFEALFWYLRYAQALHRDCREVKG